MKIATPTIIDFDIEDIAPWAGNRLIDLHMATLPSKPITRFFLNHKQKKSLGYQKLRPRYEPMDEITQTACEPLCPEGWYFDCETETCKEYSSYLLYITTAVYHLLAIDLQDINHQGTWIGNNVYPPPITEVDYLTVFDAEFYRLNIYKQFEPMGSPEYELDLTGFNISGYGTNENYVTTITSDITYELDSSSGFEIFSSEFVEHGFNILADTSVPGYTATAIESKVRHKFVANIYGVK